MQTGELTFAYIDWDEGGNELSFGTHLSREGAVRAIRDGLKVRAFVGYSGWSGGQLEEELMQRAWITSRTTKELVDLPNTDGLWQGLLRSMGPWYRLLADMPPDPSLN